MNNSLVEKEEQVKYSRLLSSFFCSAAMIILTMLCILNNPAFDFYGAIILIKVVAPASFCFWFIGYNIGKILDGLNKKITRKKIVEEKQAYEIPSMFSGSIQYDENNENFGVLWKNSILNTQKHLN